MSRPYIISALIAGCVGLAALDLHLLSRPIDISATPLSGGATPSGNIADGGFRLALDTRTLEDFPETKARPLFRPSRRPAPIVPPGAAETSPPLGATEADPPAELRLVGILHVTDKSRRALVVWPLRPAGKWVEEGEEIDGWRLTRIDRHAIRFEYGRRVHELKMP